MNRLLCIFALLVAGCAHPAVPAPQTDDPYAAIEALADEIKAGARFAREAAPSKVQGGEADGPFYTKKGARSG